MANSRKSGNKSTTVTEFPSPETAAPVAEMPEELHEPAAPPTAPANPSSKNPLKKKAPVLPTDGDFFARVAAVPQSDWDSQRVYLYLYVLEPLCNLKQQGGKAYFNRYSAPIRDEHQIAVECGSGRYRLMLAYNRVSAEDSSEMARYEFEIYNPQYPPKVPRAAWINDPRNAKWEALLPKETAAGAPGSLVDAMKVYGDIRREVRDELDDEPIAPTTSTSEVLATMKAAKDLFGQPPAPATMPAKDPLEIAVALATTMMQMKADNPVIDMYRDELKALREEVKEERARMQTAPVTSEKPKTLIEQLTDFKAIKDLFTTVSGAAEGTVRAGRTTALDVVKDVASKFFDSDLASGVGQWLAAKAQQSANGTSAMSPSTPQNGVQRTGNDFEAFITNVLNPALLRHYIQGFSGEDFAGWLYDGYPDRVIQLQNFTHPKMPGLKGANAIIQAYKHTESMWPTLSSARPNGEADFIKFVKEFCEWKPPSDEPIDAEVVKSDEDREEGPERI